MVSTILFLNAKLPGPFGHRPGDGGYPGDPAAILPEAAVPVPIPMAGDLPAAPVTPGVFP
jgi:hypothetical protein